MGINDEQDIEANLQIGPTDQGMVGLYVVAGDLEIPMDFDPEEADDIAEELRAAAETARAMAGGQAGSKPGGKSGGKKNR